MSFHDYIEAALYGEHGFYTGGRGAGRRADFLTSPEVGPLFGAVLARAIDNEWMRCGRPDPWVVIEAGAGRGTLAAAVLAAAPACARSLRYIAVEVSPTLRALAPDILSIEQPAFVLGPTAIRRPDDVAAGDADDSDDSDDSDGFDDSGSGESARGHRATNRGPLATMVGGLPAGPVTGMVVANELLDNLPFDLLERRGQRWCEVRVGAAGGRPVEVLVPASPDAQVEAESLAPDADEGARIPLQRDAGRWLRRALSLLESGRVVCIDYTDTTPSMARRQPEEWLRTYRGHGRGGGPLDRPGTQDVTCEVAVDQLENVRPLTTIGSQADWLRANQVDQMVDEARRAWHPGESRPSLAALKARSRVAEASALADPAGLGGFSVLEWTVGVPTKRGRDHPA